MSDTKKLIDDIRKCIYKYETYCMEKPNVVDMNCNTFEKLKTEVITDIYYSRDDLISIFGLRINLKADIPNDCVVVRREVDYD